VSNNTTYVVYVPNARCYLKIADSFHIKKKFANTQNTKIKISFLCDQVTEYCKKILSASLCNCFYCLEKCSGSFEPRCQVSYQGMRVVGFQV
jgi:hypothetical protein